MYVCNWLSLYNVTSIYVLRSDYLALDDQLVYSYMRKTISPTPSIPYLTVVIYVRLRSPGPSPFTLVYLLVFLFSLCLDSHVAEILGVYFLK